MCDSWNATRPILHADADPHVREVCELGMRGVPFREPRSSLRQNLELVPVAFRHYFEHAGDIAVSQLFVKEIAHRIHEHTTRCFPSERGQKLILY